MDCEPCRYLKDNNRLLFETKYWKVFVIDEQAFLGRTAVILKRHCHSLPELTEPEWQEFKEVVSKLEQAVKQAFGMEVANWACLMNHAFRTNIANPHVHWHLRPRYRHPVEFAGKTFTDPDFGEMYTDRHEKVDDEILLKITEALKANL